MQLLPLLDLSSVSTAKPQRDDQNTRRDNREAPRKLSPRTKPFRQTLSTDITEVRGTAAKPKPDKSQPLQFRTQS